MYEGSCENDGEYVRIGKAPTVFGKIKKMQQGAEEQKISRKVKLRLYESLFPNFIACFVRCRVMAINNTNEKTGCCCKEA